MSATITAAPALRQPVDQRMLVERAMRGDHDAYAVLIRAALPRLDAAARLILREGDRAADAVQDGLLRAWRDLPALRDPDRFDAWLRRLVVNACIDEARRWRRRPIEVEITSLEEPSISDTADATADRDAMARAFDRLEPEQRAVVVLRYYLDMDVPDAARSLGIPLGTAKSRLHRAIVTLRAAFTEPVIEPDIARSRVR